MRAAAVMLVFLPVLIKAQQFIDLAKVEYRNSPVNTFVDSIDSEFAIQNLDVNVLLPIELDSVNYFLAGMTYSDLYLDKVNYQSRVVQLGWQHQWNKGWKSTILMLPKSSSDGGSMKARDFQLGGFLLISKERTADFSWRFGAYVNGDRFGPLTVPIVGFKWQADPTWQIDLALPIAATIRKTFNNNIMAGLVYSGRKFSYHRSIDDSYLEVGENYLWAFADIYLSRSLVINLRAGYSILRDYQLFAEGEKVDISFGSFELGDDRTALSPSIGQSLSLQAGLIWRIDLMK